jgi:phosphopantothenoylcysteine decarboxylase/phosphopantothenate--cysteine ligase
MVSGKKIMLGVTGSIAAYKAVDILRRLREQDNMVRVVMTKNATRFVSRLTFQTLSGLPVLTDEFAEQDQGIGHIAVTDGLDMALIAPATANIIGKVAAGVADDALTSSLMALDCPIVMAPAMNDRMYRNPVLQRNIGLLKEQGVRFVEPEAGELACGTHGQGRLAGTESILRAVASVFAPPVLADVTILVTAGPTHEPIDAVRFISNPSSGKMGYALAAAARDRGASVILVTGPTHLAPLDGVKSVRVKTAAEMHRAVMEFKDRARVVIMAAAVSDFRPAASSDRKIKKDTAPLTLQLEHTEDILAELGTTPGGRLLVGFAAETDSIIHNATQKLKQKNLDMIIVNDLLQEGAGFGCDTNAVTIIERSGNVTELPVKQKAEVASRILDKIVELVGNQGILP